MSVALAIAGVLLAALVWCVLAAVSGVLGDEFKGWIAWATRRLSDRAAELSNDPDQALDIRADFEAALQAPEHRPLWLLGQSAFLYRAKARAARSRRPYERLIAWVSWGSASAFAGVGFIQGSSAPAVAAGSVIMGLEVRVMLGRIVSVRGRSSAAVRRHGGSGSR